MNQLKLLRLDALLSMQRQTLDHYFNELDLETAETVAELCFNTKGLIVLTGVGKSGIIAEKIAATLMSIGIRSLYVPAGNFLHGDIGAITSDDLVILLSKSGQTRELIQTLPYLRKKGAALVALVSDTHSTLARGADVVVELPVCKELCPFDLAPTTSTVVQLLFGDLLAVELMRLRGFSPVEYADNHPAGAIGRKVTRTVGELMKTGQQLPLCKEGDTLMEVIVEFSHKRCGCLLVVDRHMHLKGIFTDGDLRRALQRHGSRALERTMGELATPDSITLAPDVTVHAALQKMQSVRLINAAPVVQLEKVIGLIRMHDLVHEELV